MVNNLQGDIDEQTLRVMKHLFSKQSGFIGPENGIYGGATIHLVNQKKIEMYGWIVSTAMLSNYPTVSKEQCSLRLYI